MWFSLPIPILKNSSSMCEVSAPDFEILPKKFAMQNCIFPEGICTRERLQFDSKQLFCLLLKKKQ
jgi:hypothetical protein